MRPVALLRGLLLLLALTCLQSYSMEIDANGVYLIRVADDLEQFAVMVNRGDSTISGRILHDIVYRGKHPITIGSYQTKRPFCGTLDGEGHRLTIEMNAPGDHISLCPYLAHGGVIKNLYVRGSIRTNGYSSASLAGYMENSTISNCLVTVNITNTSEGEVCNGGLVGTTHGNCVIKFCAYKGVIGCPSGTAVAGLVGRVCEPGTEIRDCMSLFDCRVSSSDTCSNVFVNTESADWVKFGRMFYRGRCPFVDRDISQIPAGEDDMYRFYFRIFGRQMIFYEQDMAAALKEFKEKETNNHIALLEARNEYNNHLTNESEDHKSLRKNLTLANVITALLFILCIIFLQMHHQYRLQMKSLEESASQREQIWQAKVDELNRALNPEPTPEEIEAMNANEALYHKLCSMMKEKELFRNPDLDETMLAREVCTNNTRISKCINQVAGKGFKDWVATYRIEFAAELIKVKEKEGNLNIDEVIKESGYVSRATFYRHFKSVTGKTPYQLKFIR